METTMILSRIFGVYLIIAGVMVFTNRKALMLGVLSMFKERFAQLLAAMMSLLVGLALINFYQDWSSLASSVLSVIGWLIFLKGLLYAFLPEVRLAKITKLFTERRWYTMDGVLALVVGIYLAGYGYNLW